MITKIHQLYISVLWIFAVSATSCTKMEDFQDDPNKPSQGSPALLLPRLIEKTFYDGSPVDPNTAGQLLFYTERAEKTQYWGWATASMGQYEHMKQASLMAAEAEKMEHAAYGALANLFKQLHTYALTRSLGDVPYTEALKAGEGLLTPKYDSQKEIFKNILAELEKINNILAENSDATISGDILYNGNILKWRKLTNSYRLKILMDLSMKEADTEMNIVDDFNKVYANPSACPVFEDNTDMPRFKFYDLNGNRAPTYDRTTTRVHTKLTTTLADHLKLTTDPRLFAYAEPAWPDDADSWTDARKDAYRAEFSSYEGLDPGDAHGVAVQKKSSNIHWRYYDNPAPEDYCNFTFAEFNFIIAEAAVRGWIHADAKTYFINGVQASMAFYGITQDQMDQYFINPESRFVGTTDANKAIEQINMQKWLAFFMNSAWEPYYNNRRMKAHGIGPNNDGVPQFKTGPSFLVTQMPMRWNYKLSEYSNNTDNIKAAVTSQFGGNDETVFDIIWMLKR